MPAASSRSIPAKKMASSPRLSPGGVNPAPLEVGVVVADAREGLGGVFGDQPDVDALRQTDAEPARHDVLDVLAPAGEAEEIVVEQVEFPGPGFAPVEVRDRQVLGRPPLLLGHHAEAAAEPTAPVQEPDGVVALGVVRVGLVAADARHHVLERPPRPRTRPPEDRVWKLAHEGRDPGGRELEDGGPVDAVVRRLEHAPVNRPRERDLVAAFAVVVGEPHERDVRELPVDLRQPDSHATTSTGLSRPVAPRIRRCAICAYSGLISIRMESRFSRPATSPTVPAPANGSRTRAGHGLAARAGAVAGTVRPLKPATADARLEQVGRHGPRARPVGALVVGDGRAGEAVDVGPVGRLPDLAGVLALLAPTHGPGFGRVTLAVQAPAPRLQRGVIALLAVRHGRADQLVAVAATRSPADRLGRVRVAPRLECLSGFLEQLRVVLRLAGRTLAEFVGRLRRVHDPHPRGTARRAAAGRARARQNRDLGEPAAGRSRSGPP